MKTPVEVLEAAFAALNIDDWSGFADLCDPVSLRAFKTQALDFHVDDDDEPYHIDADSILETEPEMPRAVAEYQPAKMNEITDPAHKLKREFLTIKSVDEIRQMDPAKLFALWLQGCSPYRRFEAEGSDDQPWEAEAEWEPADDVRKVTRGYRYSVIGSVTDGGDIAHILYRTEHGIDKIFPEEYLEWLDSLPPDEEQLAHQLHHSSTPEFATCRKQSDGSWRLIANRDLRLVSTRQRIEPEPKADT